MHFTQSQKEPESELPSAPQPPLLYSEEPQLIQVAELLTSSSLYQERFSAVRTNQYSLEPPFMIPMLLMVSQPFRMTCEVGSSKH